VKRLPDLRGLRLWPRRTFDGDGRRSWRMLTLASYHRRDSLTWRWILSWWWRPVCRPGLCRNAPPSGYGCVIATIPMLGQVQLSWQPYCARPTPQEQRAMYDEIEAHYSPVPDYLPEGW
jgi:hypothetical protein